MDRPVPIRAGEAQAPNIPQAIGAVAGYVMLGVAMMGSVVTVRLLISGHTHLDEARNLLDTGDRDRAIVHLEDAAKAYVPGSPYTARALRELTIVARAAEMRGELYRARATWEVVRRSVLATRHVFQPNGQTLATAERAIKRLADERHPKRDNRVLIARPEDPSAFPSLLLCLGLLTWIAGASIIVLGPKGDDGRPLVSPSLAWIACLGGLCIWLLMAWLV